MIQKNRRCNDCNNSLLKNFCCKKWIPCFCTYIIMWYVDQMHAPFNSENANTEKIKACLFQFYISPIKLPFRNNLKYRVFQLDMTYFEVQDGKLKLTSKFKKRQQHIREMGTFEFYQYFFKKVTLAGLNSLRQKWCQYST